MIIGIALRKTHSICCLRRSDEDLLYAKLACCFNDIVSTSYVCLKALRVGYQHVPGISCKYIKMSGYATYMNPNLLPAKWITTSGALGTGPLLYAVMLKWVVRALKTCPESVRSVFRVKTSADGSGKGTRSRFKTL